MFRSSALILLGAALLAAACACDEPTAPAPAPVEMRTYAVPAALASEVRGVVDRLLSWGENQPRLGRAALGPGGLLVVSATPTVHAGIEQLVAGLEQAPPAAPAGIELTYWLVEGRPGGDVVAPELKEMRPVLDAIIAADGMRAFGVLEKLELRTLAGEWGELDGRVARVRQSASVRDGEVLAEVELKHPTGGLRTHLALPLDTYLVLGQSRGADAPDGGGQLDLYYVVRARVSTPTAK